MCWTAVYVPPVASAMQVSLLADLGVGHQAQRVHDQVGAAGGDLPGHLARVERPAGVLAVRDEHDPARTFPALQVVRRAEQGRTDRGEAGRREGGDRGLGLGAVQRPDRVELPGVLAADLAVLTRVVRAERPDAEVHLLRCRVQDVVERLLGGGHPGLAVDVAGPHRAADVEHQLDLGEGVAGASSAAAGIAVPSPATRVASAMPTPVVSRLLVIIAGSYGKSVRIPNRVTAPPVHRGLFPACRFRRGISRGRTRCPQGPASPRRTRSRRRQASFAHVPRRARPVVRTRPQAWQGAPHPRARYRPARRDAAGS